MRKISFLLAGFLISGCQGQPSNNALSKAEQPRSNLYTCEGCDAVFERNAEALTATSQIAGPKEPGERMVLTGTVYKADGQTAAPDVLLYAHQTNAEGAYAGGSSETEWSRRHGRLRGWVKTGPDGRFTFQTIKPAPYPTHREPAHVHMTVLERGRRPYWIDDVVFAGHLHVNEQYRLSRECRGGCGIVQLERTFDGRWLAKRDIVLERHPD